jgi:hypothetical protein
MSAVASNGTLNGTGAGDAFEGCACDVRLGCGGGDAARDGRRQLRRGISDGQVGPDVDRIEHKPIYRQSTWGYDVLDQRTGKVLASQNDSVPPSTAKERSPMAR